MDTDPRLRKAFPKPPMVCLKRGKNLRDELVRARMPPRPGKVGTRASAGPRLGFSSCKAGKKDCSMCPYTGRAAYCLYILSCTKPGCGIQYGGLSYRPLYQRFAEHFNNVKDAFSTCSVAKH